MKLTIIIPTVCLILFSGWSGCHCQSSEGLTSAGTGQYNILNRQISVVQSILTELSRSLSETVLTGTRAVSSNTESLASSFTPIISQLSALQQALNVVANQAQRIVDSGSRVITGQPLAAPMSPDESVPPAAESTTPKPEDKSTAASLPAESEAGALTVPAEILTRTVQTVSKQLGQMTQVIEQLSRQMRNVVTTGARTLAVNRLNPTDSLLEVMEDYVTQISHIQKSLRNANNQLNRLLENGGFGGGQHRSKRADTLVVNGLQKAATELTKELGQIGGTLARIAGGVSGVRIPGLGSESDTRTADSSSAAYQGLNPVGVISRGFGNLASSLSRIMPNTGRK